MFSAASFRSLVALLAVGFVSAAGSGDFAGDFPKLQVAMDDTPYVAYADGDRLMLLRCLTPNCSVATSRALASGLAAGDAIALIIRTDGRPLVVFGIDGAAPALYDCADAACQAGEVRTLEGVAEAELVGADVRSNGRPLLAFGATGAPIQTYDCTDQDCSSGEVHTLLDGPDCTGAGPLRVTCPASGRPIIAHSGDPTEVLICADERCATATSLSFDDREMATATHNPHNEDRPIFALWCSYCGAAFVYACDSPTCENTVRSFYEPRVWGDGMSIAIRQDGLPVISYVVRDHAVRVVACSNMNCETASVRHFDLFNGNFHYTSMVVRGDGTPLLVYLSTQPPASLRFVDCKNADCSSAAVITPVPDPIFVSGFE